MRSLRNPLAACVMVLGLIASSVAASPWSRSAEESPDGPEHERIYFTEEEALEKVFGSEPDSIRVDAWVPTDDQRRTLEETLGWRVTEDVFRVFRAHSDGRITGRAMITEQIGLYRPITFIVEVDADGNVDDICVMAYRESRGDEVRRVRFLRQYRGKNLESPIRINRDIVAVTGATLSTRAINAGVRRVLAILDLYARVHSASPGSIDVAPGGSL